MNNKQYLDLDSQIINVLRFPLILGVILLHSQLSYITIQGHELVNLSDYPFFSHFSYLFSEIFGRISVPMFFFISGYCFFIHPIVNTKGWINKLYKRINTLLLPYLAWNFIYIAAFFFAELILPDLFSGRNKLVSDYSFTDFLSCFWNRSDGLPIDEPLWFIRNLMVVSCLALIIQYLIKRLKLFYLILLGLFWLSGIDILPVGINGTTLFFFSLGAYFSINKCSFAQYIQPVKRLSAIIYVFMVILLLFFCNPEEFAFSYLHKISILLGGITVIAMASFLVERKGLKANGFLSGSTFFLFAFHHTPLLLMIKSVARMFEHYTETNLTILYLFCPSFIIGIGLIGYYLLKKYATRLTSLLTGGR